VIPVGEIKVNVGEESYSINHLSYTCNGVWSDLTINRVVNEKVEIKPCEVLQFGDSLTNMIHAPISEATPKIKFHTKLREMRQTTKCTPNLLPYQFIITCILNHSIVRL
jgi:hypothetical protein